LSEVQVGGQAVIEGVMMRSPHRISTAVRKPDGEIVVKNQEYVSFTKRHKFLGVPIIRGIVSFAEMLVISIKTLNYSADVAIKEEEKKQGKKEKKSSDSLRSLYLGLTVVFAMALGIGIFFFLPLWFSELVGVRREALAFNLVAGIARVVLFIAYVWAISRFGEFKRIFQYHGAEHKSIFTFEAKKELTIQNVKDFSTYHPRCGTSFILIVVVFAILVYSVSDTVYYLITGFPPTLLKRFLLHFSLLPLVAGAGYELLKASGRAQDVKIVRLLSAPGLWIQRITTQEPTEDQLEVALVALTNALSTENPTSKDSSESSPSPFS